jgi:hypothetical protein
MPLLPNLFSYDFQAELLGLISPKSKGGLDKAIE